MSQMRLSNRLTVPLAKPCSANRLPMAIIKAIHGSGAGLKALRNRAPVKSGTKWWERFDEAVVSPRLKGRGHTKALRIPKRLGRGSRELSNIFILVNSSIRCLGSHGPPKKTWTKRALGPYEIEAFSKEKCARNTIWGCLA